MLPDNILAFNFLDGENEDDVGEMEDGEVDDVRRGDEDGERNKMSTVIKKKKVSFFSGMYKEWGKVIQANWETKYSL